MIHLHKALEAWGSEGFAAAFKREVETLPPEALPLQQGLTMSSYVSPNGFTATILAIGDTADKIQIKTGVLYTGIVAGCNCADDPSPIDEQNEYCVLIATIDKRTAATEFTLATE